MYICVYIYIYYKYKVARGYPLYMFVRSACRPMLQGAQLLGDLVMVSLAMDSAPDQRCEGVAPGDQVKVRCSLVKIP